VIPMKDVRGPRRRMASQRAAAALRRAREVVAGPAPKASLRMARKASQSVECLLERLNPKMPSRPFRGPGLTTK